MHVSLLPEHVWTRIWLHVVFNFLKCFTGSIFISILILQLRTRVTPTRRENKFCFVCYGTGLLASWHKGYYEIMGLLLHCSALYHPARICSLKVPLKPQHTYSRALKAAKSHRIFYKSLNNPLVKVQLSKSRLTYKEPSMFVICFFFLFSLLFFLSASNGLAIWIFAQTYPRTDFIHRFIIATPATMRRLIWDKTRTLGFWKTFRSQGPL